MVMPAGWRPGSGRGGAFHCAAAAFMSTKCATAGTRFGLSHARPRKHLGAAGRQGFRNAPGMTMEPPPSQQSLPIVMGLACCNGGGLASQHALRLWAYAAPYNVLASQTDAIRYGLRRRMSQCSMPAPRHATPRPRHAWHASSKIAHQASHLKARHTRSLRWVDMVAHCTEAGTRALSSSKQWVQ